MKDQILSLLLEIVGAVKDMAPEAWEIIILQMRVQAIGYLVGAIACFLSSIALIIATVKLAKDYGEEGLFLMPGLLALFTIGGMIGCILSSVGRFINPAYYAIKFILEGAGLG